MTLKSLNQASLAAALGIIAVVVIGQCTGPESNSSRRAMERLEAEKTRDAAAVGQGNSVSPSGKVYEINATAGQGVTAVYETLKPEEIVLLEFHREKIILTSLISRTKFEKLMVLKPPTYFVYKGSEYVKDDLGIFWGKEGQEETLSIDGQTFGGFVLKGAQIIAQGREVEPILKAAESGTSLKLEKHYWAPGKKKDYPTFDLSRLRGRLTTLESDTGAFTVSEGQTRCKQEGSRKIVWLESEMGSFALNGPAITLVEAGSKSGAPWLDERGRPVRLGRDVLGVDVTSELIEAGLRKCR